MFVAVSSQCFSDVNFATACQNAADLGYDKIELWLNEASDHLKPSQIVASPTKFFQLYRETTRLTPVAITQITMPAATLGTPFNEEIDRLRSRLAASNSAGIRLSLKTKTGHLTEDPQTAVELCQAVPGLGLTLDVSYYICGRYAGQSYDQVYPYVYHTHLRDTTPSQVQVPVGLGEVDYSRIISQLRRFNYNRALSVEILPDFLQGNDRALELRKIRMLLETLL